MQKKWKSLIYEKISLSLCFMSEKLLIEGNDLFPSRLLLSLPMRVYFMLFCVIFYAVYQQNTYKSAYL